MSQVDRRGSIIFRILAPLAYVATVSIVWIFWGALYYIFNETIERSGAMKATIYSSLNSVSVVFMCAGSAMMFVCVLMQTRRAERRIYVLTGVLIYAIFMFTLGLFSIVSAALTQIYSGLI